MGAGHERTKHERIQEGVRDAVKDLDDLHKQLRKLAARIEEMEKDADTSGLVRVKLGLRRAYVKVSQSGQSLVEAHLELTIAPTAYVPEEPKGNDE